MRLTITPVEDYILGIFYIFDSKTIITFSTSRNIPIRTRTYKAVMLSLGRETCKLSLKERRWLQLFEMELLRKVFGPM
jgi:hypothetical protein